MATRRFSPLRKPDEPKPRMRRAFWPIFTCRSARGPRSASLLERHFGPRHLGLYVNDTYFVYGDEALRSYLLQGPELQGFSSHHVRRFPHWLAGREMLYVTFLRDPIQQFVSYMTHIKKHYSEITSQACSQPCRRTHRN
jgi:hypothetical protein